MKNTDVEVGDDTGTSLDTPVLRAAAACPDKIYMYAKHEFLALSSLAKEM